MALLYGLLYFPYAPDAPAVRALSRYLELMAAASGLVIGLWDSSVRVVGTSIHGRFPLEIVLDCAALDAQALLVAAVTAFPARWSSKLKGIAFGLAAITAANLGRIAGLSFIGLHWPSTFRFLHEEVFPFVIVVVAAAIFGGWALRTPPSPLGPSHAD
jgi:exosortase/archaeosortase family protein